MKATTKLGSGDKTITVGKVGHGLMMMTWSPKPVSDEEAFEAIKASLDSVPPGAKMVLNSGEFYGFSPREANLELIARFFERYPSYADKAFLSVKGGTKAESLEPDSSPENLKRSVDCILAKLRGTKKLDLFECSRVDQKYPIEDTIKVLSGFVAEGKIDYIGMSECKASTVRRAHSVHPIAAVEIEVSPWSYDDPVKEVLATCEELGIIVCAYAPLGRGFLSGKYKSAKDLEDGDFRKHLARFQEENFKHNMAIVEKVQAIAAKKGVTPAQLCIAWISALGPHVVPIPGSSKKERTEENCAAADVVLSSEDVDAVKKILEEHPVQGGRYGPGDDEAYNFDGLYHGFINTRHIHNVLQRPSDTSRASTEIRDRGSTFVASIYRASSPSSALKTHSYHKRVLHGSKPATHEILAYRCMSLKEGCDGLGGPDDFELKSGKDDDGEDNGARTILRTMEKEGVIDAAVIVSRWFGGTLLGPVRFTHIETCTRQVCRAFKLIEEVEGVIEELKELDEKLARLRSELADIQSQDITSNSEKAEGANTGVSVSTPREPPDYRAMLLSPSPDLARAKRLIAARQSAIRSVKRILAQVKSPTRE